MHGRAQLENSKYMKKHNVSAMYGCEGQDSGCGGGRGHFGGCGQILLMALMYWTQLKSLWMKNGGNLHGQLYVAQTCE